VTQWGWLLEELHWPVVLWSLQWRESFSYVMMSLVIVWFWREMPTIWTDVINESTKIQRTIHNQTVAQNLWRKQISAWKKAAPSLLPPSLWLHMKQLKFCKWHVVYSRKYFYMFKDFGVSVVYSIHTRISRNYLLNTTFKSYSTVNI